MLVKRCSECQTEKPLDQFHRDRSRSDGRMHRCAECDRARSRDHYRRNREVKLEAYRRRREALGFEYKSYADREPTYTAVHLRLGRQVKTGSCNRCQRGPTELALIHGHGRFWEQGRGAFSDQAEDYMELCRHCHLEYDCGDSKFWRA